MGCDCSSYIAQHHMPHATGLFHKYSSVTLTLPVNMCGGFREPVCWPSHQTELGDCLWNITLADFPN